MKKPTIIIITIISFLVVGGIIIAWSAYQRGSEPPAQLRIKNFTDDNFQQEVVEASKTRPIVVDFYAEWCYPCVLLDHTLKELAEDLEGRVVIGKVDTDRNLIARQFGIKRIPAVFIIRDGEIKTAFYGVVPKEKLLEALKEFGA